MNTPHTFAEKKHWMVVDDNADILSLMSMLLPTLTGAEVECFNSPQAALTAFVAAPEKYELVVTDYEMPGMDGVELCRRMRALVPAQKVFLTTGSRFFTEAAACHAGFSGLLNKPFPLALFQDMLNGSGVETRLETALA